MPKRMKRNRQLKTLTTHNVASCGVRTALGLGFRTTRVFWLPTLREQYSEAGM